MKTHGVIHINHPHLVKHHWLTLKMLSEVGYVGNWVNTSIVPVIQISNNDIEDSNYIVVEIHPDGLEINSSSCESNIRSLEWEEITANFNNALEVITKNYKNDSMGLNIAEDDEISDE